MVMETRLFSSVRSAIAKVASMKMMSAKCRKMFAGHDECSFAGGISLIAQPATGGQQMGA
jgi:hypothetical protein